MRPALKTLIPALAVSLLLAACGSSSSTSTTTSSTTSSAAQPSTASQTSTAASAPSADAVKLSQTGSVGKTLLVDAKDMTIYRLTGEGNGKFICASAACEAHWPPVSASAMSTGVSGLGTVRRPDGMEQLTYKGAPLYTFVGDKLPGETNGQGLKDVGTWLYIPVSAAPIVHITATPSSGGSGGSSGASSRSASGASSSSGSSGGSSGGGGYAY